MSNNTNSDLEIGKDSKISIKEKCEDKELTKKTSNNKIKEIYNEIVKNISLNNGEYSETFLPLYHKEGSTIIKNNKIEEINKLDSLV
jgi:hypothetical protein